MAALRLPKWVSGLAQMKPMSSPTTSKWHGFAGRHTEALNAHHIERGGTPLPPETDGRTSGWVRKNRYLKCSASRTRKNAGGPSLPIQPW